MPLAEEEELLLEALSGARQLGTMALEGCAQTGAAGLSRSQYGLDLFEGDELEELGLSQGAA